MSSVTVGSGWPAQPWPWGQANFLAQQGGEGEECAPSVQPNPPDHVTSRDALARLG